MNAFPYIFWGLTCLVATIGTILVFRSEDRSVIADQRETIRVLAGDLNQEKAQHLRTKARLSQLMPDPDVVAAPGSKEARQDIDRVLGLMNTEQVYDHELVERRATQRGWDW